MHSFQLWIIAACSELSVIGKFLKNYLNCSLHNSFGRSVAKTSDCEPTKNSVSRVLSDYLMVAPLSWPLLFDTKPRPFALSLIRISRRFRDIQVNEIMVSYNFAVAGQSQHPCGLQSNDQRKLFITGNCA